MDYNYLSGVVEYSILNGILDDEIERTIYLFADIHTTTGECDIHEDLVEDDLNDEEYEYVEGYEYLDTFEDIIRITKYLFDSFKYAEDNNFTIDLYIEQGRYLPHYDIIRGTSHINFSKLPTGALTDLIERLVDLNCGQYQKIKGMSCPYKYLRIHNSDERDQFVRKFIYGKKQTINTLKDMSYSSKLFLSPEWYIEYMFNILPEKLLKQWNKIESKYLKNNRDSIFENIISENYENNLKRFIYSDDENYILKLSIFQKTNGEGEEDVIPNFIRFEEIYEFIIYMLNPVMELYTIGRMFKKIDDANIDRMYAKNIIVYVGLEHYNIFVKFLLKYGFKILTKSEKYEYYEEYFTYNQCIDIGNLPYPAFSP